jgi:hypothetical protein
MDYDTSWTDFQILDGFSDDVIAVRPIYVKMLDGDIQTAYLFSQIIYWHLPDKKGKPRLRVIKFHPETNERGYWLAKSAQQWHEELGITPSRTRRSLAKLCKRDLIFTHNWRWNGHNTTHIQLNTKEFQRQLYMTINDKSIDKLEDQIIVLNKSKVLAEI